MLEIDDGGAAELYASSMFHTYNSINDAGDPLGLIAAVTMTKTGHFNQRVNFFGNLENAYPTLKLSKHAMGA